MDIKEWYKRNKHNHALMMVLCCGIPLILLYIAVYYFGVGKNFLYWFIILLCPILHLWMMRGMHKKNAKSEEPAHEEKND